MIKVLDQATINKIAAGEVVERPSSVVKELVENAIDAGSTAVTVEIKDGGISFIRITDNGKGIEKDEVPTAFIRHATSKIETIEDLLSVSSLGFRGEALASISAVAQVECITKTSSSLTGIRYEVHGSKEIAREEIGAPTGTTIIVRNLFYNVPARKKFLKSAMTEGGYITELVTRLALSHPEVSIKYIINGKNKIATSGNGQLKDVIYHIYGKDVSSNLLPVKRQIGELSIEGYIGKAYVSKGNRSFEHYFINGRSIRSTVVTKAIEEGYKSFVMIHKFPFTALHLTLNSDKLDVNVHPQKMEFKYADSEELFQFVKDSVRQSLLSEEMIQDVSLRTQKEEKAITIEQQRKQTSHIPEPFEQQARALRYQQISSNVDNAVKADKVINTENLGNTVETSSKDSQVQVKDTIKTPNEGTKAINQKETVPIVVENQTIKSQNTEEKPIEESNTSKKIIEENNTSDKNIENNSVKDSLSNPEQFQEEKIQTENSIQPKKEDISESSILSNTSTVSNIENKQMELLVERFISEEARKKHRLIGQVFKTFWMIEYDNKLYIVDQHAAHEKVMFERLMKQMSEKKVLSQQILPPKVLNLDSIEHSLVLNHMDLFTQVGFEIEDFGDDSLVLRAMPDDIMGVDPELLFDELLNVLSLDIGKISIDFFVEKLSTMACKAAIKGNTEISFQEADALIDEMLSLDNPYNCPHGRPTTISISEYELERKFKRIQD